MGSGSSRQFKKMYHFLLRVPAVLPADRQADQATEAWKEKQREQDRLDIFERASREEAERRFKK